jgi:hypothetical protein
MEKGNHTKVRRPFFKRRGIKILLIIVVLLIGIRLALPYIVLKQVNKTLSNLPGYFGHVQDIDLAIYRGAYQIKNIYLHKIDTLTNEESEFFDARLIDLSVHWGALLEGKIVGELSLDDPRLKFTKDKVEPKQVAEDTTTFRQLLDNFMPLRVNRFDLRNGVIQYEDFTSNPKVNIQMDNTRIVAENLTTERSAELMPSTVTVESNIYGGKLDIHMKLDPLAEEPTFDMNTNLTNTNLPEMNDFFKAYGKFDVNKGNFGLYAEVAGKDGKFIGYVKPLIKDLDVLGHEDRKDNILQKVWEAVVGGAGQLLRNQKHDQVATKVPLEGSFKNTKADIWTAIWLVLKNAFIQALQPSIDQEINIASVNEVELKEDGTKKDGDEKDGEGKDGEKKEKKGFLKKIFNKRDEDRKKEEEKSATEAAPKK